MLGCGHPANERIGKKGQSFLGSFSHFEKGCLTDGLTPILGAGCHFVPILSTLVQVGCGETGEMPNS
jgi:hypothetical protein